MIKLIASDLDGTLLKEGTKDVNPELFDVVKALKQKGITFVAASGRELDTIRTVVRPVEEDIYCIANNGGRITKRCDENLLVLTLDWDIVKNVIEDVRKDPEIVFVSVNTIEGTYTDSTNTEVIEWLKKGYGMNPIITDDMIKSELHVMKISVFAKNDANDIVAPYIEKYGDKAHVTVAGAQWIDFTHTLADKGIALKKLMDMLSVTPEETWAFGDNGNDISMLKAAGTGFASPEAREAVKKEADICLEGDLWDSVINQIKTLL